MAKAISLDNLTEFKSKYDAYVDAKLKQGYYTKAEVESLHANMKKASMAVFATRPESGQEGVIYLVGTKSPYDMWVWEDGIEGNWIDLGPCKCDMTGYAKTAAANTWAGLQTFGAGFSTAGPATVSKLTVGDGKIVSAGHDVALPGSAGTLALVSQIPTDYAKKSEIPTLATAAKAGLVKPVAKTDAMTLSVGVDAAGALFTAPSGTAVTYATNAEVDALFA